MKNYYDGQTLIGMLVAIVLIAILGQAIFTLTNTSYQFVSFNRSRIAARHIGQEKIEIIRNLPFDDVGTQGGIPTGNLLQTETVSQNGLSYTIKTSIVYIDDPFDGIAPTDLLPTDYKRVRVDVSWEGLSSSRKAPIVLVTDIAPRGIETTAGGGTLSILVFDANAIPVSRADVHIEATSTNPAIDLDVQTNENGRVILPGAPICIECYSLTVSKEDYSSEKTYTLSEVANPNTPQQSIIEGLVTEISFAIDKVSTMDFSSVNDRAANFTPRANVNFILRGDKTIGTDIDDLPVYKYYESVTTDALGLLTIENIEWDNYSIILPVSSGIVVSGTNPLLPVQILPETTTPINISFSNETSNSFLGIFTDGTDPIASISATLIDSPSYEETKFTGVINDPDFGQVFFSALDSLTYTLTATASGYEDFSDTINVSGYTSVTTIMTTE